MSIMLNVTFKSLDLISLKLIEVFNLNFGQNLQNEEECDIFVYNRINDFVARV